MCENCKNKNVCKWVENISECENFKNSLLPKSPIKITIECEKRRVINA